MINPTEAERLYSAVTWTLKATEQGTDRTAHFNYGIFLEEDGRLAEAEHYYRHAAEVIYPGARNRLALLLWATGRDAEAETWFRQALADREISCDDPGDEDYTANSDIMHNLAVLLEETGRPEEAADLYRQAAARAASMK